MIGRIGQNCRFILPFNPLDYEKKAEAREKPGYGQEPLEICSIGGTSVGMELRAHSLRRGSKSGSTHQSTF
jgi:hypothetical protein